MRNNYQLIGLVCCLFLSLPLFVVLIPTLLVDFQQADVQVDALPSNPAPVITKQSKIMIDVSLSKEKQVVSVPLEEYVRGVVASEMPIEFHMESLRAQAMAARTYIISRVKNNRAHVTDTVKNQVYATDKILQKRWGIHYQENMEKVTKAVHSTTGQIITYQGKPIYAAFFSTSNGHTENSEDYFQEAYPYLRSVTSPWDKQSPKYKRSKTLTLAMIVKDIEKRTGKKITTTVITHSEGFKVLKRTTGGRIAKVKIGDYVFSGRVIREALGLASSDFTWIKKGRQITFITYGFGHGVGMSQWGANLLAQQGKKAEDIIHYYYQGVKLKKI